MRYDARMPAQSPSATYQSRFQLFQATALRLASVNRRIANARLTAALVIVVGGFFWWQGGSPSAVAATLIGVAAFAVLMVVHERRIGAQRLAETLAAVNEAGIARLEHRWIGFTVDGGERLDAEHRYAQDLDIFGRGSVFQWINAAHTAEGRTRLASWLAEPPLDPTEIRRRQASVAELANELEWRQQFEAAALLGVGRERSARELVEWSSARDDVYGRFSATLYRFLPLVTVGVLVAAWFLGDPWSGLAVFLLILQFFLWTFKAKANYHFAERLQKERDGLGMYEAMLAVAEGREGRAFELRDMAWAFNDGESRPSAALHGLKRLADWLEVRRQPLIHLPLNILFLWDARWIVAAERWRRKNGAFVPRWLDDLFTLEALSSLAHIGWEHPHWTMPELVDEKPCIEAEGMGHPLLPDERRVTNDVRIDRQGEVFIVTGSNMSGKSTFLRTVGINMILARLGTPVCAKKFRVSPLRVYTSMRNADNLEKSISSFYAELLRVKLIVEAAKRGEEILFLVDEIFRGTNSADRHTGAEAVIRRLSDMGAVGLVSTHDLDLASLADDAERPFVSCHFAEHYENGELRFDYRLQPGVATTRNAMHLMRMVGIVEGAQAESQEEGEAS